jgi:hypothetical protein
MTPVDSPLRVHIDETLVTIKQTFDDKTVSKAQVAYWYIICANTLLGQHIAKRDSGAFLATYDNVPVLIAAASQNPNVIKDRKHIELPGFIFDYDKDGGVEYIAYTSDGGVGCPPRFTRTKIERTSPSESQWLYDNPNTTPSPKRPYWYRVGNLIYFLGLEKAVIKAVEIGIYQTIDPVTVIDIDKPLNFPHELMPQLKRQVVDLARYNYFFPAERQNTGNDETSNDKVAVPKIVSVNQPEQ